MKKTFNIIFIGVFVAFIFIIPVITVFMPRERVSDFENRQLAVFPSLSRDSLAGGTYFSDVNTWLSDHIAFREQMLSSYVFINLDILHKPIVNDIYVSGDRLLPFLNFYPLDSEKLERDTAIMLSEISALRDHVQNLGGRFYYAGIPGQFSVFRDDYPFFLYNRADELEYKEKYFIGGLQEANVNFIDMRDAFGENIRDYYLRVDHHYTFDGAYLAYRAIMDAMIADGVSALPAASRDEIDFIKLPNPFLGSRNRVLYNFFETDERLSIGNHKSFVPFTRYDNGAKVESSLFTVPRDTSQPIAFTIYMGGDQAETVIDTSRPELPNLLIFGDSYTNPVETLIYANFNKTYTLDLRHYNSESLYDYISRVRPDAVVCLRDDSCYTLLDGNGIFK